MASEVPAFRSGKWSLHRQISTNSDHLMLDMLRTTSLCNLGSYWLRDGDGQTLLSRAVVRGFEGRVAFGCLQPEDRSLSAEARAFQSALEKRLPDSAHPGGSFFASP